MKFLQVPGLAALTNCMTVRTVGDFVIDGRIEAYSCKQVEEDRQLEKELESKIRSRSTSFAEFQYGGSAAPDAAPLLRSTSSTSSVGPFGDLQTPQARQVFAYLVETL